MIKSPTALSKLLPALDGRSLETLPESMRRAVRLMVSGAAATAVWGIFLVIVTIVNHSQLVGENGRKLSSGQVAGGLIYNLLVTIILAAVWVLMARTNQRGRNWARIAATMLFVGWSIECFTAIGGAAAAPLVIIDLVLVFLIWTIGLVALFFLWRPDSSDYYKSGGHG
jgi:hypothetical protein